MARTGIRAAALIVRDGKVLLIHRKKEGKEYWVFPGGGIEDNETAEEALKREVKEELNLDVLEYKLAFYDKNEKDGFDHPYFACIVSDNEPTIVGEEKDRNTEENSYTLEWVSLSEINDLALVPLSAKEKFISSLNK